MSTFKFSAPVWCIAIGLAGVTSGVGCSRPSAEGAATSDIVVVRNVSAAMEPTLRAGQEVAVSRSCCGPPDGELSRGMLVMYARPHDTTQRYIKRVMGLPGDSLAMLRGVLHINGRASDAPTAWFADTSANAARHNWGPLAVPQDSLFVLGDNRDSSLDSRYWGFLPVRLVRGRVVDPVPSSLDR